MKRQRFGLMVAVLCFVFSYESTIHALQCPRPPEQMGANWETEVDAAVAKVLYVKGAELKAKVNKISQDLLGKLPNADRVYLEQMMYFSYCTALRDDKSTSEKEKAKRLKEYSSEVRQSFRTDTTAKSSSMKDPSGKKSAMKQVNTGQSMAPVPSAPSATALVTPSLAPASPGAEVKILHKGRVDISVVDSTGKPQQLEEVYVSCAQGDSNVKGKGRAQMSVPINDCIRLSVNCQLANSTRWIADVWHQENKGLPLILTEYTIIVNGTRLDSSSVRREGDHANYVGLLVRQ